MRTKYIIVLTLLFIVAVAIVVPYSWHAQKKVSQLRRSSQVFSSLATDRSVYVPGQKVAFSLNTKGKSIKLHVRYYHLDKKIGEQTKTLPNANHVKWTWQPPKTNGRGYLATVSVTASGKVQTETIAVDVSRDWSKFPRYGFLSNFPKMPQSEIQHNISQLNRYHINGLQFYDWSEKHHQPLTVKDGKLSSTWTDIANRPIEEKTIRSYISAAHHRQMKGMSYNLIYGALAQSEQDGTKRDWFLFKDQNHDQVDVNPLPSGWKSDIYLMNPANPGWQDYLINQQKIIYRYLPFDGWHVDQLGDRGNVYDENGQSVSLSDSFGPFLNKIKAADPNKDLVMNAVGQFGQGSIASSGVNFLYTEVWDNTRPNYQDLKQVIDENNNLSSDKKNTVLAAYMDYKKADQSGTFNEPGILLTDSVIFASGGDHIELGEHMLSKEYFPNANLSMSRGLTNKLTHYYDFLTAYENLLRDGTKDSEAALHSEEQLPISDTPEQNHIWAFAKTKPHHKMIHLINFLDANSMKWRDTDGSQAAPQERRALNFTIDESKPVEKMWMASPDYRNGVPIAIPFHQKNGKLFATVPSLLYWDMLVLEYR
ncbi:glycoside hydrolase family 66 protein [Sporolactobacillus laevolacticus]|uniref:Cycloisomaltooligosaccharide glucanotransferase n=1 Tax=Sporolactobacillus laevolacticus DSM 442 TaxID=1395513 RepID=V6IY65_9BACL|nr:glycoside hydrolase family 66 protein [Sporolactobacillus laevolacticus]EST12398.1 cycloisomaltooligosaccharide glucanotransferase [Sporolactobacillus laevolacticus DSM 442]